MEALKRKWKSRRGASILLALLFLLVCMMAAASILMAAASDAGKIDSNKKEQQKYLTLSSALTLVCDDLERMEYVGVYDYVKTPIVVKTGENGEEVKTPIKGIPEEDPDLESEDIVRLYYEREYTRKDGVLRKRTEPADLPAAWGFEKNGVFETIRDRLDYMFARHFIVPNSQQKVNNEYNFNKAWDDTKWGSYPNGEFSQSSLTLELKVDGTDTDTYGSLLNTVKIDIELRADGSIKLKATLWEEIKEKTDEDEEESTIVKPTDYTMTAVLRPDPDQWLEQRLVIDPYKADENEDSTEIVQVISENVETEPIRWKLDVIVKEENE